MNKLLIVVIFLFGIVGCSNNNPVGVTEQASTTDTKPTCKVTLHNGRIEGVATISVDSIYRATVISSETVRIVVNTNQLLTITRYRLSNLSNTLKYQYDRSDTVRVFSDTTIGI